MPGVEGTTRRFAHLELHFSGGATLRDIVIGMSDGLTVPFALAAGISGAIQSTGVIVTAGLAEVAAGSIAMALGGYLSATSETEHYDRERRREQREIIEAPDTEASEVVGALVAYGLSTAEAEPVVAALRRRPDAWADFMMRFELGLERPMPGRALASALTIGGSYVVGGLIPLFPYMIVGSAVRGLLISCALTATALAIFGYAKGRFTGMPAIRSAIQTVLIGGAAAGAAFAIARAISA
jgi:VIT1/CCC1 family predicted Fe2+/Mn2+ transporter